MCLFTECQPGSVDLAIVLDASKSISDAEFAIIAEATKELVKELDIGKYKLYIFIVIFSYLRNAL